MMHLSILLPPLANVAKFTPLALIGLQRTVSHTCIMTNPIDYRIPRCFYKAILMTIVNPERKLLIACHWIVFNQSISNISSRPRNRNFSFCS